ncbi:MAG: signal peptidase I [Clostridia bacterium]|nr:signal peptidase I [Clostridia bacterium]
MHLLPEDGAQSTDERAPSENNGESPSGSSPNGREPRFVARRLAADVANYVNTFIVALVLAAFMTTFVARSFVVRGKSMEPTLHDGERLLVDELGYRSRAPARGQVIVFRYPANPQERYIKRVIGLPGERVAILSGLVFVDGEALDEHYTSEPAKSDYGPRRVPEGALFVLGDNRNASQDSRDESVGMVPVSSIEGRAFFVFWPPSRAREFRAPVYRRAPGSAYLPGRWAFVNGAESGLTPD